MSEDKTSPAYLLTDEDILQLAGNNAKILEYPDLYDYSKIEDIFKDGTEKLILLYLADKTPYSSTGHWVCVLPQKNGKVMSFFCPYGIMPDSSIEWTKSKEKRQYLNQDEMYLTKLLLDFANRGGSVEYNEKRLQEKDDDVSTCGRHVGLRCLFNKIPLKQYQNVMMKQKKDGWNTDDLVTELSNDILGWK